GAASGFVVLDPQIVTGMQPKSGGLVSKLTPRQREVLGLIAQGFTNASIAQQLYLSEKSVENQINAIYHQLEIARDTEVSMQPRVKAVLTYLQESQELPSA
ncbi:MAG: LuxR C-terminal-related transcriptional regulator, partial [Chloroflexi bacterium]|nr:LuxR C-terminal-related transcriptional regulator [Chloroflexota bacterium]